MERETEKTTIGERQEKDKEALVDALKETPIVQAACHRAGVSRATYYRWRNEDDSFRRESEDALQEGYEYVNDLGEAQVIALIKDKKLPAITLWLRHHHPRYGSQTKPRSPAASDDDLTDEEKRIIAEALSLSSGKRPRTKRTRP